MYELCKGTDTFYRMNGLPMNIALEIHFKPQILEFSQTEYKTIPYEDPKQQKTTVTQLKYNVYQAHADSVIDRKLNSSK